MFSSGPERNLNVMVPTVLALLLGAASSFGDVGFRASPRPQGHRSEFSDPASLRARPSTTWDDPFSDLYAKIGLSPGDRNNATAESRPKDLEPQKGQSEGCSRKAGDEITLCLLVPGGSTPEYVERRLRARYTVHAALNTLGFVSSGPLETWKVTTPKGGDCCRGTSESFVQTSTEPPPTLVCSARPNKVTVRWIGHRLLRAYGLERLVAGDHPYIIGPHDSETLEWLVDELHGRNGDPVPWVRWFSPWATTSLPNLEMLENRLRLERVIGTDTVLLELLSEELKLRGGSNSNTTLIVEWDTTYGRALYEQMKGMFEKEPTLVRFGRAIDGAGTSTKGSKNTGAESFGPSRLDYLNRLATELARREQGHLHSVGILCSDVYDKLMVLQALRPRFPGTIFFTTDLDARLTDPAQRAVTRNLIVASHYGLRLSPLLHAPEFRWSYQSALYVACLRACGVSHIKAKTKSGGTVDHYFPKRPGGQIFELGRSGPVRLGSKSADARSTWLWYARDARLTWGVTALVVVTLIVSLFLLFRPFFELVRRSRYLTPKGTGRLLVWSLAPLLAIIVSLIDASRANGEPWIPLEGISGWPTVIARVLVTTLSFYYLRWMYVRSRTNARHLNGLFFGKRPHESERSARVPKRLWLSVLLSFRARKAYDRSAWPATPETKETTLSAKSVWKEYLRRSSLRMALYRTVRLGFVLGLFSVTYFCLTHPPCSPMRGGLARTFDQVTLVLEAAALAGLVLVFIDTTAVATRWIFLLGHAPRQWPAEVVKAVKKGRGVSEPAASHWLAIQLIGLRTEVIERFVYFPFVCGFIAIVIHNRLFDAFDFPPSVLWIMGMFYVFIIAASALMHRVARRAMRRILARMRQEVADIAHNHSSKKPAIELMNEANAYSRGAFKFVLSGPLLGALLIPGGGLTLLHVLQLFLDAGS